MIQMFNGKRTCIIGVGNRMRGDDGVGSVVAERLKGMALPDTLVIDAEDVPENYTDMIREVRPELVVFIDAADFGGNAGEWRMVDMHSLSDDVKPASTHTLSLKLLASLLESEGIKTALLAIQPKRVGWGAPLSEEVKRAVHEVISFICYKQAIGGEI